VGPEVDPSKGTVHGTIHAVTKFCAGEDNPDNTSYIKINQTLTGVSTDALDGTPFAGDFTRSGNLKSMASLTINKATGQGWGTGLLTVTNANDIITGPVTVVVQIIDQQFDIIARGQWVGTVRDLAGNPTGDFSVQNFELSGNPTSFSGSWGGSPSPQNPDLSVKTTKVPC
jgi:hypothetical protein